MDITSITQQAKTFLLRHQEVPPTLFVEFVSGCGHILPFANFPTAGRGMQSALFFELGRTLAQQKEHRGETVKQLCFVCKGWTVSFREGRPQCQPTEDPARQEVLVVQSLDVQLQSPQGQPPYRQTARLIDILRDGAGEVVDLLPHDEEAEVEAGLLSRFIAGFEQAARKAGKHKHKEGKGKKKH